MTKQAKTGTMKRYHLVLPQDLFDAVEAEADARSTTTADLIRQFLRLGALATQPGTQIIVRKDGQDTILLLL